MPGPMFIRLLHLCLLVPEVLFRKTSVVLTQVEAFFSAARNDNVVFLTLQPLLPGVDLRTVQQWLEHSDMESTMRNLKPSLSEKVREKVNQIFA